jgi:peptide/nickel transport system permease protein
VVGYVLRRVAWAVLQLFAASLILFVLFYVAPGPDLSVSSSFSTPSHGEGRARFQETGSASAEYKRFMGHILHGELGRSQRGGQDVAFLIKKSWPATASLVIGGLVLWLLISLSVGIYSALRPRSLLDRVGNTFVLVGIAAHPLWLGLMLSYIFGYRLHWFPFVGYCDMIHPSFGHGCGGPVQWAYHLVLPWLVFAAAYAALYARMIRSSLLETGHDDYVRTARAKGLSERAVMKRHTFRVAMLPLVTMLAMDIGLAFGSTIFVERVFEIPGLGRLLTQAIPRRDLPVILGVMIVVSLVVLLLNLFIDIAYGFIDPRITLAPSSRRPRRRWVARDRHAPAEPKPVTQAR